MTSRICVQGRKHSAVQIVYDRKDKI